MLYHFTHDPVFMAPGSCWRAADPEMETTSEARKTSDKAPSMPEGILDMMGPKTLEGGYSSSQ